MFFALIASISPGKQLESYLERVARECRRNLRNSVSLKEQNTWFIGRLADRRSNGFSQVRLEKDRKRSAKRCLVTGYVFKKLIKIQEIRTN